MNFLGLLSFALLTGILLLGCVGYEIIELVITRWVLMRSSLFSLELTCTDGVWAH